MKNRPQLFTISDFAKLAQTTRKTLHYYDKIGLLPPTTYGKAKYRYYSASQLSVINVIRILQELGMTLEEIAEVKNLRSPEYTDRVLTAQLEKVDEKINNWVKAKKLLLTLHKAIDSSLNTDTETMTIKFCEEESIILGDKNDYSGDRTDYIALQDFYYSMREKLHYLDLNYPVWGVFSKERILRNDWHWPDRYYFYNPEGADKKPAALYAIGSTHGAYGQTDELYRRLVRYIYENDYEICGDTYEEYPLNELSNAEDDKLLIRVMITVTEKRRNGNPSKWRTSSKWSVG